MCEITVIIPHYNVPHLLRRCLDSIPDDKDIRVIVVDNNSSSEIVDFNNFPGRDRIFTTFVFDKEGNGAGHARNVALNQLTSKWVLFADSDDFFTQDAFEIIRKYIKSDADVIMFKTLTVDSDTLKPATRQGSTINSVIDYSLKGKKLPMSVAYYNQAPWCKLIKTDLVVNNNIRFDEVRYANDIMFSTKVAYYAKQVELCASPIYTLTIREGSLTSNNYTSSENFMCRLNVKIRRNLFLRRNNKKQSFLTINLLQARHFGFRVLGACLTELIRNRMLFSGLSEFLKYEFKTKFLKQEYYIV